MQSFARLEAEVAELRLVVERLLSAQMPVLSWWALANVLTRTATTLTVLAIIIVGTLLTIKGQATVGEMVTFMNFPELIIARLERGVCSFANSVVSEAHACANFPGLGHGPVHSRPARAIDPGRLRGRVEFKHVSFSYDGKSMAIDGVELYGHAGRNDRACRRDRRGKDDRDCATSSRFRSAVWPN